MEYFDTSKDLNSKVNIMAAIDGIMEQMTFKTEILKQETSYERTLAIAEDFTALMNEGLGNILINPDLKLPVTLIVSAFAQLTGVGGAPLASMALGRNDKEEAEIY